METIVCVKLVGQYDCSRFRLFFFFKQKTAYEIKECDWSSDVCSSDLIIHLNKGETLKLGGSAP